MKRSNANHIVNQITTLIWEMNCSHCIRDNSEKTAMKSEISALDFYPEASLRCVVPCSKTFVRIRPLLSKGAF